MSTIIIATGDMIPEADMHDALSGLDTGLFHFDTGRDVILKACADRTIGLYILSTRLEEMNAYETIIALRQMDRLTPIVLLTEHITLDLLRLIILIGGNELIQVPINKGELRSIVTKYLQIKKDHVTRTK